MTVVSISLEEIGEGQIRKVNLLGKEILFVQKEGKVYALDHLCTHTGEDLSKGYLERILESNVIVCPRHRAKFDIANGRVVRPPAQGIRIEPLRTYPVVVENSQVRVDVT
jgi:3-phenylpropionate/trans-cinnamate dioxygenase ferredoxin subunit